MPPAPTLDDLFLLAQTALDELPEPFRTHAKGILLRVEDWPDDDMLDELDIDDPLELTGLYDGIPLPLKSVSDPAPMPDTIWLFREPILAELADRGNETLEDLVRHIVVHEVAHHFGWTDDDIAAIDRWWE